MNKLIKAAAVVGLLGLSAGANASMINVGGVNWDPDSSLDFSSASVSIYQNINASTGVVSGYGIVSSLNGTNPNSFCPSCELTFQFGGFTPVNGAALPDVNGSVIGYTGGFVNFFVDNTPEITNPNNPLTLSSVNTGLDSDSQLWLSLTGHGLGISNVSFVGISTNAFGNFVGLSGIGQFDVTGGLASGNLDTNTKAGGSDIAFSTGFTTFPSGATNAGILNAYGTGNLNGNSIPEPGSLALLGLGLLGFGAARRKA